MPGDLIPPGGTPPSKPDDGAHTGGSETPNQGPAGPTITFNEGAGPKDGTSSGRISYEDGALPDGDELRAGSGLAQLGFDVTFQVTKSSLGIKDTRTADLKVKGLGTIDVYSPVGLNLAKLPTGIEKKASQADGVMVQVDISSEDMRSVVARVWGKPNPQRINTIIFQKSDGSIVRFDRN